MLQCGEWRAVRGRLAELLAIRKQLEAGFDQEVAARAAMIQHFSGVEGRLHASLKRVRFLLDDCTFGVDTR